MNRQTPPETKVLTAHVPLPLAKKVDQMAARLERSRGWIMKQALAAWIDQEEERSRLTREALAAPSGLLANLFSAYQSARMHSHEDDAQTCACSGLRLPTIRCHKNLCFHGEGARDVDGIHSTRHILFQMPHSFCQNRRRQLTQ